MSGGLEWVDGGLECPDCCERMLLRRGSRGKFLACTCYPRCKGTARLKGQAKEQAEQMLPPPPDRPKPEPTDIDCPECGAKMVIRMSRRGRFLGCAGYPQCRQTMELPAELAEQVRRRLDDKSASKTK